MATVLGEKFTQSCCSGVQKIEFTVCCTVKGKKQNNLLSFVFVGILQSVDCTVNTHLLVLSVTR